jgi:hypothetical protein
LLVRRDAYDDVDRFLPLASLFHPGNAASSTIATNAGNFLRHIYPRSPQPMKQSPERKEGRMGQAERDNRMLMRVAAILLLLASVAMRASSASFSVRCRVFVILCQGEEIARLYALGAGVSALTPNCVCPNGPVEPADLMGLALRFCMLALMLQIAAGRSRPAALLHGSDRCDLRNMGPTVTEAHVQPTPDCPDTS